jgi:hypothetical protein
MGRVKLWRSRDETKLLKLTIYQAAFEAGPPKSQRTLARELQVSQPHVCRIMRGAAGHLDELAAYRLEHGPVTPDDLQKARSHSQRMGLAEARLDEDSMIAIRWREVVEWRRHPSRHR